MLPFPIISQLTIQPSISIIKDVQAGTSNNYVLTYSGNLYVAGLNSEGQLGLGDTTNRNDAWYLSNSSVDHMWVGSSNTVLIKKVDGTYWRAGRAYAFSGSNAVANIWTDVSSLFSTAQTSASSTIVDILVTNENVLLLMANGTVWGSGRNLYGALGTGNSNNLTVFTNLGLSGITKICSTDQNIFAFNGTTGTVYGAGSNSYSQLNTTASTSINTFRTVTTGAINIWCGLGTTLYVQKSDGLYAAGWNANGEFGAGSSNSAANVLIRVSTTLTPVNIFISKGNIGGGVNLKLSTGEVYVSGSNAYTGGLGTTGNITTWTHSPDKDNSTSIAAGGTNRCLLVKSDILYGCGTYNATYTYLLPPFTTNVTVVSMLDITGIS